MEKPNLNYINSLSGNDDVFKQKIINTFKKELPKEIDEYSSQMEKGCFLEASEIIHKIKHKISIMGMEKSYYLAEEFEFDLKNQSAGFNEALKAAFDKILAAMLHYADSL
ncbi:Hpt domain-containing protein [Flavobacterium aestuarii]|uniref:Hpt domain-containing protein n=1 Tax=Flavobacterium aestuarii TaxID=3149227 RepID=UPI0032B5DCDE